MRDKRVICQVCGLPEPREYQLVHKDEDGTYEVDDEMDLCPGCGQRLSDALQTALPEIIGEREKNVEGGEGRAAGERP